MYNGQNVVNLYNFFHKMKTVIKHIDFKVKNVELQSKKDEPQLKTGEHQIKTI